MELFYKLKEEINAASSLAELKALHEKLDLKINEALAECSAMDELLYTLAKIHDAIVQKALYFAELQTFQSAVGERPKRWCWFVMGSMGRNEPAVWTDQDNGILFDCEQEEEVKCYEYINYFAMIGTRYLEAVGYPYCPGNVMATNQRWSNSIRDWREKINAYITNYLPDDIRFLLMAVDIRPIYGDFQLVEEEKHRITELISQSPIILKRMGEHSLFPKIPLGLFGNFLEERYGPYCGQLDLKYSGYVQIINCIKFLSLSEKITANTTLERLERLKKHALIPKSLLEKTEQAFLICLYFRLKHTAQNGKHDYHVHLQKLNKEERTKLKKVMKTTKKIQRYVLQRAGELKDV
jgi:CBS domain-containing protein